MYPIAGTMHHCTTVKAGALLTHTSILYLLNTPTKSTKYLPEPCAMIPGLQVLEVGMPSCQQIFPDKRDLTIVLRLRVHPLGPFRTGRTKILRKSSLQVQRFKVYSQRPRSQTVGKVPFLVSWWWGQWMATSLLNLPAHHL
jgi:hypothetical protein